MIDDFTEWRDLAAYNVLASYLIARAVAEDIETAIISSDFATTVMRSALVSSRLPEPAFAEVFMHHLIQLRSTEENQGFPFQPLSSIGTSSGRLSITGEHLGQAQTSATQFPKSALCPDQSPL